MALLQGLEGGEFELPALSSEVTIILLVLAGIVMLAFLIVFLINVIQAERERKKYYQKLNEEGSPKAQ